MGEVGQASNPLALCYLAGLIDGEGSICVVMNHGTTPYPSLSIVNTDTRMMIWLESNFGGSFGVMGKGNRKQKVSYQWRASGGSFGICNLLIAVAPYLVVKRVQALLVAAMRDGSIDANLAIRKQVATLNKKGPVE